MKKNQFIRCSVKGSGKILSNNYKGIKFQIIDLSADGARIFTTNELNLDADSLIKLDITLPAFLIQVKIKANAKVVQKKEVDNGFEYDVEFVGLSERDQLGIDEMLRNTSNTVNSL